MKRLPQGNPIPVGIEIKDDGKAKWKSEWVEIAPGRKRLVSESQRKVRSERYAKPGGGRNDETWEEERYRRLYHEKMIVCEDLKAKHMRGTRGYVVLPDGREGPLSFNNPVWGCGEKAARIDYLRAAGIRESGGWR